MNESQNDVKTFDSSVRSRRRRRRKRFGVVNKMDQHSDVRVVGSFLFTFKIPLDNSLYLYSSKLAILIQVRDKNGEEDPILEIIGSFWHTQHRFDIVVK
jgi:hypothetical protein